MKQEINKFIKDVIHDQINFDEEWVLELISTPEFLRLHQIKQLGLAYKIFPCATHTRYSHSLGTYKIARRFIENFNFELSIKEKRILYAAAILHDIGHGPHSHSFEVYTNIGHEEFTKQIILDSKTQINNILKKHNIDPKEVVNIIDGKHKTLYFNSIISSQIDADRLDYLARDSHYSGACYGKIDIDLLIKWAMIKKSEMVFDYKAVSSIENFIIGRMHMYKEVYEKPKLIGINMLVKKIMDRLKEIYCQNKMILIDRYNIYELYSNWFLDKKWTTQEYLKLNDNNFELLLNGIEHEKDKFLKEAYQELINFNASNYLVIDGNEKKYQKLLKQAKKDLFYPSIYMSFVETGNRPVYNSTQKPILIYNQMNKKNETIEKNSTLLNSLVKKQTKQVIIINYKKVKNI